MITRDQFDALASEAGITPTAANYERYKRIIQRLDPDKWLTFVPVVSEKLLRESSVDIEQIVRRDLINAMAHQIDEMFVAGATGNAGTTRTTGLTGSVADENSDRRRRP